MSRADVEAGVSAGLEAAAGHMLYLSVDAPRQGYNDLSEPFRELAKAIRSLDPAAIAATVARHRHEIILDLVDSRKRIYDLEHELAAMRDCDAKAEALDIILQAATDGTDWVYAEVPQQIEALRQRIAELERQLAEYGWLP